MAAGRHRQHGDRPGRHARDAAADDHHLRGHRQRWHRHAAAHPQGRPCLRRRRSLSRSSRSILADTGISDANLAIMRRALVRVTAQGTGASAFRGFDASVAGKTGTAEVKGKDDYAWFAGFAPANECEVRRGRGHRAGRSRRLGRRASRSEHTRQAPRASCRHRSRYGPFTMRRVERTRWRAVRDFVNAPLFLATIALLIYGSIVVSSATSGMAGGPGLFKRHLLGIAVGLVPMVIAWAIDYKVAQALDRTAHGRAGFLAHQPADSRTRRQRRRRHIVAPDCRGTPVPAVRAREAHPHRGDGCADRGVRGQDRPPEDVVRSLGYLGVAMVLILLQPDLGTGLVFVAITMTMLLVGGMKGRYFADPRRGSARSSSDGRARVPSAGGLSGGPAARLRRSGARPAGSRLQPRAVQDRDRLGRAVRAGPRLGHAVQPSLPAGAAHRLHLLGAR